MKKAVALVSGGLDSMLAAKAIMNQGVHVEGLNFFTGFCHSGHTSAIRKTNSDKPKRNDALWVADQLGIKLHIIDVIDDYKDVLLKPKYGYGANKNPCLDCKIFMVRNALKWAEENGFDFLITGEVVGQRPKSQLRWTMPVVAKQSGANDRLLRPLCAKLLPETLPEREGWVDREKLYNFSGRNRKPQIALAKELGFDEFTQPSGGCCVLTDESYSTKLEDFWEHREDKDYELDDIVLLKVGRHVRPQKHFKLIIGREEGENNFLSGYRKQFAHMRVLDHSSPLVLVEGKPTETDLEFAARITARYSKGRDEENVRVEVVPLGGVAKVITVHPMAAEAVEKEWFV